MKKIVTENFGFTIKVIEGSHCRNGHEVGDTYTCEYGCPMPVGNEGDFCSKSMAKVYTLCEVIRCGGDLRTIGGMTKYSCTFRCPDGVINFQLDAYMLAEILPMTARNLSAYTEVIRRSFATVANDFLWTKENAPTFTAFIPDARLADKVNDGYFPFGLCIGEKIIGFVSLTDMGTGVYELNNLAVLPEYRHFGYGKRLLDFCKAKIAEFGGTKITIGIVEENEVLKEWYIQNGFVHTGTKRFAHQPFTAGFMEWRLKEYA